VRIILIRQTEKVTSKLTPGFNLTSRRLFFGY